MKKNEIDTIVKKSFIKFNRLFQKIIAHFEAEDIQEFRMEIKKLRAFFHLLDMEKGGAAYIKITRKMKTFYGYIGIIRNIQLHLVKINDYCENVTAISPVSYVSNLEKELEYWKKNTKEFMDFHNNFYDDEDRILIELPGKLSKASIKKFVRFITYELRLQKLPEELTDETVHDIRKLLEDMFYNWTFVKPYFVPLSAGLSCEKEIGSFIDMLGTFRDKCIDITLLQTYYDDCGHDAPVLQNISNAWKIQKRELKQVISDWIDLIQLRKPKAEKTVRQTY